MHYQSAWFYIKTPVDLVSQLKNSLKSAHCNFSNKFVKLKTNWCLNKHSSSVLTNCGGRGDTRGRGLAYLVWFAETATQHAARGRRGPCVWTARGNTLTFNSHKTRHACLHIYFDGNVMPCYESFYTKFWTKTSILLDVCGWFQGTTTEACSCHGWRDPRTCCSPIVDTREQTTSAACIGVCQQGAEFAGHPAR